jgi:hypothetical protein
MRKLTVIAILTVIALAALNIFYQPPQVEPDAVYPMANTWIVWEK